MSHVSRHTSHIPFKLPNPSLVLLANGDGLMGLAVEAGEDAQAGGFHGVGVEVAKLLPHFQTFVADFEDLGLAHELVVELHGCGKVELYMHQNQIDGFPIDLVLQHFFQIKTPSKIKIVALDAVIDMDEGV